jgi:hypothetical protein
MFCCQTNYVAISLLPFAFTVTVQQTAIRRNSAQYKTYALSLAADADGVTSAPSLQHKTSSCHYKSWCSNSCLERTWFESWRTSPVLPHQITETVITPCALVTAHHILYTRLYWTVLYLPANEIMPPSPPFTVFNFKGKCVECGELCAHLWGSHDFADGELGTIFHLVCLLSWYQCSEGTCCTTLQFTVGMLCFHQPLPLPLLCRRPA